MFSSSLANKFGCNVLTAFIIITVFSGIIGMFCWPYGLNTWLIFIGKPATVLWYHGFLIG
ncbi:unnamed protein product, partial [marine sediment metagenome]